MRNPHDQGSHAWALFEAAESLADLPKGGTDEQASAIDRQTMAMYRLGAAFVESLNFMAQQIGTLAEQVEMLPFRTETRAERSESTTRATVRVKPRAKGTQKRRSKAKR